MEALAELRRKLGHPSRRVQGRYRLSASADVVESVRASGPGYNTRVEQALRAAGFGAKASKKAKMAAKQGAKPAVSNGRTT